MSRRAPPRCAFCGGLAINDGSVLELHIRRPDAEHVVIRFHTDPPCADQDPLHEPLAVAIGLPDGEESDMEVARAYLALLNRIRDERGADGLLAAVEIKRDLSNPRVTLRGRGLSWGRQSARR